MNTKCEISYKKRKKKYKYNNIINIDSMSITNDNINGNFNENNNFIIDNNEQNLMEYLLDQSLPNSYKKIKINDDNFNIININEYSNLLKINYNMIQLKKIAKYYNLKTSGNKPELTKFLYNSLLIKSKSIYIQKIYRKCLTKNFLYLHGPCIKYSSVNDTDFGTLDEIKKIKFGKLISFKDDDASKYFLSVIVFIISLSCLSAFLTISGISFEVSFKLSILTLMNTVNSSMYGLSEFNFQELSFITKIYLVFFMIIGRVELLTIFIFFKKYLFKN